MASQVLWYTSSWKMKPERRPMTPAPTTRSPAFYRATLVIAAAGIGYVVASGRLAAYLRLFRDAVTRSAAPPERAFADHLTTALIWLACLAPLLFASWELGRQHVAGRRLGHPLLVGIAAVFRIALRGTLAPAQAQAFARAPSDRVAPAALRSGAIAVVFPAFFLVAAPPLRTPRGVLWLCVAAALVGAGEFFRRRAVAYIRDEPRDLLRTYRLLNPARYEPPGSAFVKLQLVTMVALAIWWLAGGALLLG